MNTLFIVQVPTMIIHIEAGIVFILHNYRQNLHK
jgi:hypothetical protein